jgi:ABC-2 type transport system ATP-binding protein
VSDAQLRSYGDIVSIEGKEVRLVVPQEKLTSAIARIVSELDIIDLSINEPPIEEIIGRLFQTGVVA